MRTTTFTRGSGVYRCAVCNRRTRDDGNGDSVYAGLCTQCWEMAGIENAISDGCEGPHDRDEWEALRLEVIERGGTLTGASLPPPRIREET